MARDLDLEEKKSESVVWNVSVGDLYSGGSRGCLAETLQPMGNFQGIGAGATPAKSQPQVTQDASCTHQNINNTRPHTSNGPTMRRVVVTGLGAITPLAVGIRPTWKRLLASESGIASVANLEPAPRWRELPSTVAGLVPQGSRADDKWQASDWLEKGDERRMAKFTQYAIAATEMALLDAGWRPHTQEDREMTGVCLGSGIGNLEELYNTSVVYEKTVSYK